MAERLRLLVSVRSVDEALLAADAGVDFIDCKEPRDGALGGLPVATIADIVAALVYAPARCGGTVERKVSATIGDTPEDDPVAPTLARVRTVAACGVDYVKVGIARRPTAGALLSALAGCGVPVIPVFVADDGLDSALVAHACRLGFAGVMADTANKRAGSLFDLLGPDVVRGFVATARASGTMVGVAGALRIDDLPGVIDLAPTYAGFRSAVCHGDRAGALDPDLLRALRGALGPRADGGGAHTTSQREQFPTANPLDV